MLKKLLIFLFLFICFYPLKAQDKEPDFVRIFNEKFEYPKIAFKAQIDLEVLLKVHKTIDSFNICYDNVSAGLFKKGVFKVIDSSDWVKSFPLGDYFIYVFSIPIQNLYNSKNKKDFHSVYIPDKFRYIINQSKVYTIEFEGPYTKNKKNHDSLLTLYYNDPDQIWNSEKVAYSSNKFTDIDSGDKLFEFASLPSLLDIKIASQIIIKADSSIILRRIRVNGQSESIISSRRIFKNNRAEYFDYQKIMEYYEKFKTFPIFRYPIKINDGSYYKILIYENNFIREYEYFNPETIGREYHVGICKLFSNLMHNYLELFKFE